MKALTIKQPLASLIAHGIKDIENRTWRTNYSGRIYVHAGKFSGNINDLFSIQQWNNIGESSKNKPHH